ncbi:hypothetical protein BS47DRAFT_654016 [Hydnum rufescens UP504]|uniref:Potassium channel domain-containing protein n=1 Tax=Hydnum rufescens UP504 TaxID=1448309 RepID=A0A9P6B372_9AGAM|nr:hypothetical protein BS47DRAFT_654016 [Hydnum rufescens UP504]
MSRWRVVLSAILVPTAVVFAIPGLAEPWYALAGDHTVTKQDPPLLIVGQSMALAFNATASVLFLFRVNGYETLRYTVACSITLFCALLLDLLCLAIFGASHSSSRHNSYELSTAFYLTFTSSILTLIALLSNVLDAREARKSPRHRRVLLTPNQRILAMVSFTFMVYLAIGCIIFKYLLELTYLNAAYFVMTSTLTVGYGDILPTNTASKIVAIFYFPVGIILVVMLIALIRVTALASMNARFVRGLQAANRRRKEAIMKRRAEATARRGEIVPAEQDEIPTEDVGEDVDELRTSEDQESYEKMLKDAAYKHHNTYAAEILLSFIALCIFWVIGAVVFMELEGWSFFIAFYFTFITYTVIGYGEYTPTTPGSRAFYIVWGVAGIVVLTLLLSLIAEAWSTRYSNVLRKRVIRRHRTLQSMDVERAGDGGANAMPPHISALPSWPASPVRDVPAADDHAPLDSVKQDPNVLEKDITDHRSAVRPEMDFKRMLDDCDEYLLALLDDDHDGIRRNLSKVVSERDGARNPEMEKTLLKQEADATVTRMLLKHIHNEIVEMKQNVTVQEENRLHRNQKSADASPGPSSSTDPFQHEVASKPE